MKLAVLSHFSFSKFLFKLSKDINSFITCAGIDDIGINTVFLASVTLRRASYFHTAGNSKNLTGAICEQLTTKHSIAFLDDGHASKSVVDCGDRVLSELKYCIRNQKQVKNRTHHFGAWSKGCVRFFIDELIIAQSTAQ